uniref:BPI2 domain-containing protein n=1 Tax=Parastrongyloides trichosuri TaxID=131310 RepID=A0A0N5A254_PARTI
MFDAFNITGLITPKEPELFKPRRKDCNSLSSYGDPSLNTNIVPETQFTFANFKYKSRYNRDDALVYLNLSSYLFFKQAFNAFPVSSCVKLRFFEKELKIIIDQSPIHSFTVTMKKELFETYKIASDDIMLSVSSRGIIHAMNNIKQVDAFMRLYYFHEGSDVVIDVYGSGMFTTHIPTFSNRDFMLVGNIQSDKIFDMTCKPKLLSLILSETDSKVKAIAFQLSSECFEVIFSTHELTKLYNIPYESSFIKKVTFLETIKFQYPLEPLLKIRKALSLGDSLNFSILENGLLNILIIIENNDGPMSCFELFVVPLV